MDQGLTPKMVDATRELIRRYRAPIEAVRGAWERIDPWSRSRKVTEVLVQPDGRCLLCAAVDSACGACVHARPGWCSAHCANGPALPTLWEIYHAPSPEALHAAMHARADYLEELLRQRKEE